MRNQEHIYLITVCDLSQRKNKDQLQRLTIGPNHDSRSGDEQSPRQPQEENLIVWSEPIRVMLQWHFSVQLILSINSENVI